MEEFAVIIVRGLGLGAVFALVAMSFNVVHNSSGILNFAQGNMLVLGGILRRASCRTSPTRIAGCCFLPVAALALASIMTVQGYITLLPLRSSVEQHSWLITTLAVSVMIGAVILMRRATRAEPHDRQFPSFPLLRHAHADALRDGDHAGARLVCGAALVPHAAR